MDTRAALRPVLLLLTALALVAGVAPAGARAQADSLVPAGVAPESDTKAPPFFELTPREARRIANRQPAVRELRREHPDMFAVMQIPLDGGDPRRYQIQYAVPGQRTYVADVNVDGRTGRVLAVWTGPQAYMPLARGGEPYMGESLNEVYVWLPLALLFLAPFFDPRRPFRLLHLDLLVLLGFGASVYWFNRGDVEVSVPLVYPLLAYLAARMLYAGFRPRERREPLMPYARVPWLAVGLVALVAFRIVLNLVDPSVVDIGYASVIGADRIQHGEELYVFNEVTGDTYGPVNYLAYLPFELVFPTNGTWGFVPAAHAAAITFDLLVIVGLMLLGKRLRRGAEGRKLGLALGYAWAAYPFSLYALQENTNDALVALLVIAALLAIGSAPLRGIALGLATAAKFVPLALAPLLATGLGDEPRRSAWPAFAAGLVGVCAVAVFFYLPDGGLREFYDTTIGFQLTRPSAFSPWGQDPALGWIQDVLKVLAIGLAAAVAFVPGRRDLRQVIALAAAVTIVVQATATHWFYFYIVWFAPLVLAAAFTAYREPSAARAEERLDGWTRTGALSG